MPFAFTWASVGSFFGMIFRAAVILIIGHFLCTYLSKFVRRGLAKTHLDVSFIKYITKAVNYLFHIIVILSALNAVGISTTGLLAALSAAAVAGSACA